MFGFGKKEWGKIRMKEATDEMKETKSPCDKHDEQKLAAMKMYAHCENILNSIKLGIPFYIKYADFRYDLDFTAYKLSETIKLQWESFYETYSKNEKSNRYPYTRIYFPVVFEYVTPIQNSKGSIIDIASIRAIHYSLEDLIPSNLKSVEIMKESFMWPDEKVLNQLIEIGYYTKEQIDVVKKHKIYEGCRKLHINQSFWVPNTQIDYLKLVNGYLMRDNGNPMMIISDEELEKYKGD